MSEYNRNVPTNSQGQAVPGTPMQQMWHVLNFHEQRLQQMTQHLQEQPLHNGGNTSQKSEALQLVEYNTLLQQVEDLTSRVNTLEAEKEATTYPSNMSLTIEEDINNSSLGQPHI